MDSAFSTLLEAAKGWGGWASFLVVAASLALGYFKFVPELVKARAEAIRIRAEAERIAAETEAVELAGYRKEVAGLRDYIAEMRIRYDERMDAADRRHRECEDRNEELTREVRRQNRVIQGMLDQFRQAGITSIHLFEPKGDPASPLVHDAMDRLAAKGPQIPPRDDEPPR